MKREHTAALIAGAFLLVVYWLTLAPDVTWWDSGELIAAAHSLGIPHPPGAPLYVLLAHVSTGAFAFAGAAASVSMLSAVCTAVSCALGALLVTRYSGSVASGVAAAICAGSLATVWLNATEAEVYAPALCLSALTLWSAARAGESADRRWLILTAYLFGIAAPLHLTGLVAAPAAIVLASVTPAGRFAADRAVLLLGALLASAGVGKASALLLLAGVALIAAHVVHEVARKGKGATQHRVPIGVASLAVVALGASAIMFMLLRAGWDPGINQGNPATLQALIDVLARSQYDVAPLFPRQAPSWLQFANYFQYLDWQFALGIAPSVLPSPARTLFTLIYLSLAMLGIRQLGFLSRRLQWAMIVLVVSASLGVVFYLNLKAGASIGYGMIPDTAPHEARERDYFFLLSFWAIGLLAGAGAVALALRFQRAVLPVAAAIVLLPMLLNYNVANRRAEPNAALPVKLATALLQPLPRDAVLIVAGDNDTYPLWYMQVARGLRPDVAIVTVPLLGAEWYREELRRRHALMGEETAQWNGLAAALHEVYEKAAGQGRALVVAISVPAGERELIASDWVLTGFHYRIARDAEVPGLSDAVGRMDMAQIASAAALTHPNETERVRASLDPVPGLMAMLLECPHKVLDWRAGTLPRDVLDSSCNFR